MKRAVIVVKEMAGHQFFWGTAFIEGLRRHGWQAEISTEYTAADLMVLWGVRRQDKIQRAKAAGAEVCIVERGYVGDRFEWSSVSFGGGLNGRATFRGPFCDPSRWQRNFAPLLKPWKPNPGGYALIMGQVRGDCAVSDMDLDAFYARARKEFEALGIQVRLRPHPRVTPKTSPSAAARAQTSLQHDLAGARCVVTWNSNSAVDAVLAGVPAIAMDEGSMAWAVTGHELNLPPAPEREAWAHAIAWKQWKIEEISSGYCWEIVGHA